MGLCVECGSNGGTKMGSKRMLCRRCKRKPAAKVVNVTLAFTRAPLPPPVPEPPPAAEPVDIFGE